MSSFTDALHLEEVDEGIYKVTRSFRYYVDERWSNLWVDIPCGYVTDVASIPKWAQWIYPTKHPHYAQAAVVHDWLCEGRGATHREGYLIHPTALETDLIFLQAMKVLGCPWHKRWTIFSAVRAYAVITKRK